ncbi:MAG: TRL domain-containing protein [Flavobacteriales bacterium]
MKKLMLLVAVVAFLSSCTMTMPVSSSGPVTGPKSGTASANVILGLHFNGDYSIEKAAANGGITKVATVKTKYTNVLLIFQSYKTTVTGE